MSCLTKPLLRGCVPAGGFSFFVFLLRFVFTAELFSLLFVSLEFYLPYSGFVLSMPIVGVSHFACKVAGRDLEDREGERVVLKRRTISPSLPSKNSHPPPLNRLDRRL